MTEGWRQGDGSHATMLTGVIHSRPAGRDTSRVAPYIAFMVLEQRDIHGARPTEPAAEADWDAVYADQLPRIYNYFRFRLGREAEVEDRSPAPSKRPGLLARAIVATSPGSRPG